MSEQAHDIQMQLSDGTVVTGEVDILGHDGLTDKIDSIRLTPEVSTSDQVIEAIVDSDMIVIGPGCFYTTLVAPLLTGGVLDAVRESKAKKVWVANMSNFPSGHCDGWKLSNYLAAFEKYL